MTNPMQEEGLLEAPPVVTCANCKQPIEATGGNTPLCASCREHFVRFPIPRSIQLFGAGIILVMIIAMFSFPKSFSAGMHLKKGKIAAEQRRYRTAQREFEQVVAQYPSHLEGQARLLMAAFHNLDLETMANTYQRIKNRPVEDQELYSQVEGVLLDAVDFYPSDSLNQLAAQVGNAVDSISEAELKAYIAHHPGELYPVYTLANRSLAIANHTATDTLLDRILAMSPAFKPALDMKLAVKRQLEQTDSALNYTDRLLRLNREHIYALSTRARLLLIQKNNKEALQTALEAHGLDESDGHAAASLALAHHFNGQVAERDALIKQSGRDSVKAYYFTYVTDVITGKEPFAR